MLPRRYRKRARKDYLAFAKCKKHTAKKIRKALRQQLSYVKRDIGYLNEFYAYIHENNVNVGTAYITLSGKGNFTGSVRVSFSVKPMPISKCQITSQKDVYTYDGKEKKPVISVTNNGVTLTKNKDYTVSYKDNKNIGKATIIVKGKGSYVGTAQKTFTISPKKVRGTKVKSTTKGMQVTWKGVTGASSYYVYRRVGAYGTWKKIAETKKKTYLDKKAKMNGEQYFYAIYAQKNKIMGNSATVKGTYQLNKMKITSVYSYYDDSVKVSWKSQSRVTGYQLQYSRNSGFKILTPLYNF